MYQVTEASDKFGSSKPGKSLQQLSQEFLSSKKYAGNLIDIIAHFESGMDTHHCLSTLQMIFIKLLKRRSMVIDVEPLRPNSGSAENQYKSWLQDLYDRYWSRILACMQHVEGRIQLHAMQCAVKLLAYEIAYPLEARENMTHHVPMPHFKALLNRLLLKEQFNVALIESFADCLVYDDVRFHAWKSLCSVTLKNNPPQTYIVNYLTMMEKMAVAASADGQCLISDAAAFYYDEQTARKCMNRIWECVMQWTHSSMTNRQLFIVLLSRVIPHLEKPLLMVDFLMDSLDGGGPIALMALHSIFSLVQTHNIDYPHIYTKLYSMFEPEIFHTKFKSRLFALSDMFLCSTHLPETLVAAFAKRLARLALVAPSPDIIVICNLIGNLILRHRGLKILINNTSLGIANDDPFIMEERDPMKSNAMSSSLWELKTLQNHTLPAVAIAARFINQPLPSTEYDIAVHLDDTLDDCFDKEIKYNPKLIATTFDRPEGFCQQKSDMTAQYWQF